MKLSLASLLLVLTLAISGAQEPASDERRAEMTRLEKALQADRDSIPLLSAAGDAALFASEPARAVKHFERMIELDPAQDAPHWRLGIAYYFNRQWEKSARQFAKYHEHDAGDRENGIWKFLGDVQQHGLERARAEMLPYTRFDREPFPALYDLLAGKLTPEQFAAGLEERKLTGKRQVIFFAHYYSGLYEEVLGHHEAALAAVRRAVSLYTPEEAEGGGPGYMWQVARVHLLWLAQSK